MASSKNHRCHYEVLCLSHDCTMDDIRSAYKKLALQRHPDKLMLSSGLSQAEATVQFQELSQAYEVLSDSNKRACYDSHRSHIGVSSNPPPSSTSTNSVPRPEIPNLNSFFTNKVYSGYTDTDKGFYKVYHNVFNKIYANEISFRDKLGLRIDSVRKAPVMGNLESPYTQITEFYNYWLSFSTVMDFCWVDDDDDQKMKLRKKAKRVYNERVRGLADFVKKKDKRVINMMIKKNEEMEKKKKEEMEKTKKEEMEWKKKLERERIERAKAYEEPEWSRVNEKELEKIMEEFKEEEEDIKKENGGGGGYNNKEELLLLYCVVCGKKFKSEKQWKNHEQSKKHKEKVGSVEQVFCE